MEILARRLSLLVLLAIPFLMGNKGCYEGKSIEHPVVGRNAKCVDCHEGANYSPDTKPTWHDKVFDKEHGKVMRRFGFRTDNNCIVCHAQSHCMDCHKREEPRDHTQFFKLKTHGIQMGLDRTRCMACHTADSCESCHRSTQPLTHTAGWGAPAQRHCLNCHYPLTSAGAESCTVCHKSLPSHALQPALPKNAMHGISADCRNCHFPLRHPDSGLACTVCHGRS